MPTSKGHILLKGTTARGTKASESSTLTASQDQAILLDDHTIRKTTELRQTEERRDAEPPEVQPIDQTGYANRSIQEQF